MAKYKPHSNEMLRYMQHAFYQINQTKRVFKDAQQIDTINHAGKTGTSTFQNGILCLIIPIRWSFIGVQQVLPLV